MSTQSTFNILGLWMIKCLHYSNNKCLKKCTITLRKKKMVKKILCFEFSERGQPLKYLFIKVFLKLSN